MRLRAFTSIALITSALALISASPAAATDYCVGAVLGGCSGSAEPMTRVGLQNAIESAHNVTAQDNRVLIGPGTIYLSTDGVIVAPTGAHTLSIVGSGLGATTIAKGAYGSSAPGMPSIGISSYAIGAAPPVISDVTLTGSTSTLSEIVLDVHAGLTLNRVRVAASAGAGDEFHYGIQAVGAAPLIVNNSSIEVSGASVEGIASAGPTTVQLTDTRVSALGLAADSQVGAEVLGALIGKRVSFTGLDRSIHAPSSSSVELDDSLVVTSNDPDSTSIWSGADLKLRGVTLAGTTTDQVGITVGLGAGVRTALIEDSVIDLDPAAQQFDCNGTTTMTIKNTLLDLTDFNDAAVSCGATALMLIDGAIHPPLFVDSAAGNYRPTAASPVVDSGGNDASVPGRTDLDGNARYLDGNGDGTAIIDLGAYEYQPVGGTPPGPPIGAGTPAATPLTIKFGKAVGKFKIAKKRPKGFALTTAKKKPRLPIHLNVAGTIVITLAKNKGKTLKGSQTFSLPAGDSYLKFTGKWNKKKLAAGKYVVSAAPAKQPRDITKSPLKLAL